MTIANENNRNDYTGNGAVDTFSYTFKIFAEGDLLVTQRDDTTPPVETTLVLNTDYTVTGVGDTSGGTIVLLAGNLVTDYLLSIRREVDLVQNTDIRNQGVFFPEIHEDEFDYLTMALQQLDDKINRSIQLPETGTGIDPTLPVPAALNLFRWNAAGTALENITAGDISGTVTTFGPEFNLAASNLTIVNPNRFATAGGTVDVITGTSSPAVAALTNNLTVIVEAAGANATTTPTFNLDTLGTKTIVKNNDEALEAGDIPGANFRMHLTFDSSLDKWILNNPANAASIEDIQAGRLTYITTAGSATVYTATFVPAIVAYTAGMLLSVKMHLANTSTTPTINANGKGAKTIKRINGAALLVGDLPINHQAILRYDGTDMILLNPALHDHSNVNQGGGIAWQGLPDGAVVQVVNIQDGAVATGSTQMVLDDSIPQNTEGDEYMTLAITPKATTNKLLIEVILYATNTASATLTAAALFQNSIADALAAGWGAADAAVSSQSQVPIRHYMVAGTTSPITFKVRAGVNAAGTTTFNGSGGSRLFGGVFASSITITEIKAA